jgi:hypothetical protein
VITHDELWEEEDELLDDDELEEDDERYSHQKDPWEYQYSKKPFVLHKRANAMTCIYLSINTTALLFTVVSASSTLIRVLQIP